MKTLDDPKPTVCSEERYRTAEEIAQVFSTTPQTINKWRAEDIIPAEIEEGSVIRYDLEIVRKILKERAAVKRQMRRDSRAKMTGGVILG